MKPFLVDAQLPVALARWLDANGYPAKHVSDIGKSRSPDGDIWQIAITHPYALITKDEDFAQRKILAHSSPSIIWIRIGNTRKQALLDRFAIALPDILDNLQRGETLIEII